MDAGEDGADVLCKLDERRWAQLVSDDLEPFAVDPFAKHVRITVDGIFSGREEQTRYRKSRRQQPMEVGFFLSRCWHGSHPDVSMAGVDTDQDRLGMLAQLEPNVRIGQSTPCEFAGDHGLTWEGRLDEGSEI